MKYSPEGGAFTVKLWQGGGEARLSIHDSGIGVPAADLPHLFDRFHRGSNVDDRRFSGLGLGLYMARMIVTAHGGRIWATSTEGEGTTFDIALPLQE